MSRKTVLAMTLVIVTMGALSVALEFQIVYASPYTDIDVDTAYNIITNGSYPYLVVLDVRTQGEYDSGHIYGAVWIPHTELEARICELAGHENHEIIVYCRSGGRSVTASGILDAQNFTKVYNLLGGILAWQSAGYPVWVSTVHNVNTTFDYDTIQAAIDAPQTSDGHTILIDAGTYYEHVVVHKSISIVGENRSTTTIDGDGTGTVFTITQDNINITGFTIQRSGNTPLDSGIYVKNASRCHITRNNLTENRFGIILSSSSKYNYVSRNEIIGNNDGISLFGSSNTIFGNNVTENSGVGIYLYSSHNNTLSGNVMNDNRHNFGVVGDLNRISFFLHSVDSSNLVDGKPIYYLVNKHEAEVPFDAGYVALVNCTEITVRNLTLTNNVCALLLVYTNDSYITKNSVANNDVGILLGKSPNNTISQNNITANCYDAIALSSSSVNTISGNNVTSNGIGINLYSHSDNNCISGNNIKANNYVGILLDYSTSNAVFENNITDNGECGVELHWSSHVTVSGNKITNNNYGIQLRANSENNNISGNEIISNNYGIGLAYSSNNSIYHNNFIDNTQQVNITTCWECGYADFWDNGVEGNYWSEYTGVDSDHNGIGDSPYMVTPPTTPPELTQYDYYPLMGMSSGFNTSLGYNVNAISNSTIEDFAFFESNSTIKMYVSNMTATQTFGFCRVCIPIDLMSSPYAVIIDDGLTEVLHFNDTIYDNGTHRWIYFAYEFSTHEVDIIPEFPLLIILPLFAIATLLAVVVYRRKHSM